MATDDVRQLEKNVSASFSYVKKDMLMINDALSDIHDKIQNLSMSHAALLQEIQKMNSSKKTPAKKAEKKKAAKPKAKKKTTAKKSLLRKQVLKRKQKNQLQRAHQRKKL